MCYTLRKLDIGAIEICRNGSSMNETKGGEDGEEDNDDT
jgi:hypothetical protein